MNSLNKTFLPIKDSHNRTWYLIDCTNQSLGRLATTVTCLLKGKLKCQYHPAIDIGDYVILINAENILINKMSKQYLVNNPGRPGSSLKIVNTYECLAQFAIKQAVKRMLTETESKNIMKRLKIYNDQDHKHQAQNPIEVKLGTVYASIKQ